MIEFEKTFVFRDNYGELENEYLEDNTADFA